MPHTLLLADGNTAIQRIVALMFAREDVRVVSVSDGEDAVARIADERPDIVLADVATPKRSGYEVSAFVKGRPELAHIPVLLLAGALEPVDPALAEAARCDGVLVKPFEPQQVVARVRALVGGARGDSTQVTPGVPRPIDRLVAPRPAAAPATVSERREETGLRVVKRPETPAAGDPGKAVRPSPPAGESKDDPMADYFDQLDAAFDHIDAGAGRADLPHFDAEAEDDTARLDVPTLSSVLGRPAPAPAGPDARRRVVADPFEALVAADEEARQVRTAPLAAVPPPALNEQLIEAVATRVIERLAPDGVDSLVSRIVSEVAERLVREEIDRIRGRK